MKTYLTTLIEEKGTPAHTEIQIEGHFGLTYEMLIDYIDQKAKQYHSQIKTMLVQIDFKNGDVFHYLKHLASGMLESLGYSSKEIEMSEYPEQEGRWSESNKLCPSCKNVKMWKTGWYIGTPESRVGLYMCGDCNHNENY